ncbi:unnamed protein product [Aphanomyces euteiches]|uniref:RRM domain-containing protein n=2 Tax=Aphanomyces euteiches TaxID=100861 RepID=A0A6G0X8I6_9STRA|nr:hypothetical protein Ae201684_007386 [Aphanomyces euteiches]KAH9100972.1 hypothetical protein Ae201684P_007162 [Aphanomyces euteiches]KAH9135440.1 hypothetical protein AeRB84_019158 [Aphanomyces euteiches]
MGGTRVYVGNLPMNVRTRELDDLFYKYGRIRDIDIKQPSRPPAYAFIEFEDHRDAEDAIRGRDGYEFDGQRLRVERTTGGGRRSGGGGDRDRDRDRDRERDSKGFGRNLMGSGKYSVTVTGLPDSCAWQDLKDFMRKIGDVIFAKVDKKGGGFVEFTNREDMLRAISKFDDTEFKTRTEASTIRVKEANYTAKKGRSRSNSPRRGRSYSRSSSRSRSRSSRRSRSRSDSRDKKDRDEDDDDEKKEKDSKNDEGKSDDEDVMKDDNKDTDMEADEASKDE